MAPADPSRAALLPCAVHPDAHALDTCQRCGSFFCEACATWVLDQVYCAACGARSDLNHLEVFRMKRWGRRDVWGWLLGFWGVVALGLGVSLLRYGDGVPALLALACSAVGVGCFFGRPWARTGLLVMPGVLGVVGLVFLGPGALVLTVLLLGQGAVIHQDPGHKLFHRVPVPDAALRKLWERRENNPLARLGFVLGWYGLLVPVLAPVALGFGIAALRRVNPDGHPPIGRKGQAMASVVLGLGSLVLWWNVLGSGGLRTLAGWLFGE